MLDTGNKEQARRSKSDAITSAVRRLEGCITKIECFISKQNGSPPAEEVPKDPIGSSKQEVPIFLLINDLPGQLNKLAERIEMAAEQLQDALV